jgi:hypothetical protein
VETSALAYLDLLKIYHSLSRRDEYDQLRDDFNKVFNAQVPVFDAYSDKSSGLEAYHNALARIESLWPSPKVLEIIEESIFRKPGSGDGEAFGLEAYRELLLLYAMAKDVVERGGNVMDFDMSGLSQPPAGMDSQPHTGFSNTSIQPLSASLEVARRSDSGRDSVGNSLGTADDEDSPLPDIAMPRPSPRLGLDIDLSEPAPLSSAFMEIADEPHRSARPELSLDLPMDSIDSGVDDDKPMDSNMVDFDLFDAATERDIAPKKAQDLTRQTGRWVPAMRDAHQLTAIARNKPASPAQLSTLIWPCAMSQPPLAAPKAWPAYMADVFKAIEPAASAGAIPTRRACCAELDEKQPKAQGTAIRAASIRLVPSGHSSRLSAMLAMPSMTDREAPMRSMLRDISTLPRKRRRQTT